MDEIVTMMLDNKEQRPPDFDSSIDDLIKPALECKNWTCERAIFTVVANSN